MGKKVMLFNASVDLEKMKKGMTDQYDSDDEAWIPVEISINSAGLSEEEARQLKEKLDPVAEKIMEKIIESMMRDFSKALDKTFKDMTDRGSKDWDDLEDKINQSFKNSLKN